jgi:rhodanese-related sulfurtransferase
MVIVHDYRANEFRQPVIIALAMLPIWAGVGPAGHGTDDVVTVTAEQVKGFLDAREKMVLIDLRPASEFHKTRLPGARSVPMKELEKRFHEIPQSGRVVLYCDCSQNELIQEAFLSLRDDYDYRNISIMGDAFSEWVKKKYPIEKGKK